LLVTAFLPDRDAFHVSDCHRRDPALAGVNMLTFRAQQGDARGDAGDEARRASRAVP